MAIVAAKLLSHRYFVVLLFLLVVCTHVPSQFSNYVADDYMQGAIFSGSDNLYGLGFENTDPDATLFSRLENGFHFFNHAKGTLDGQRSYGNLPWWSVENASMQPFRPVAAMTHWIDHNLLGGDIYWMQWHSTFYFLLFSFSGFVLYRRLHGDPLVFGLATLMLVFDMSVSANFSWIAARNSYLAVAFGAMTLLWFIRWRETDEIKWLALSLSCLAIGLLTAEAMVGICGYLGAYGLCMDRRGWLKGCLAVIPYLLIVVIWRIAYNLGGFGAYGIGLYTDPGRDFVGFVEQLISVVPLIYFSQLTGVDGLLSGVALDAWGWVRGLAWLVLVGVGFAIRHFVWSSPLAKFMLLGSILATVPHASLLSVGSRSGTFVSIGFFFVLALWLSPYLGSAHSRLKRMLAWSVIGYHFLLPMLFLGVISWGVFNIKYVDDGYYSSIETEVREDRSLVIVNPKAPNRLFYLPYEWDYKGYLLPRSVKALAPGLSSFTLHRTADREFELLSASPLVVNHRVEMMDDVGKVPVMSSAYPIRLLEGLVTHPDIHFVKGDVFEQKGLQVRVLDTDAGVPTKVKFTFVGEEHPNDMVWQWFDWSTKMYKQLAVPMIGEIIVFGGPL